MTVDEMVLLIYPEVAEDLALSSKSYRRLSREISAEEQERHDAGLDEIARTKYISAGLGDEFAHLSWLAQVMSVSQFHIVLGTSYEPHAATPRHPTPSCTTPPTPPSHIAPHHTTPHHTIPHHTMHPP